MKRRMNDFAAKFGALEKCQVSSFRGSPHKCVVATFRHRHAAKSALLAEQLPLCYGRHPFAIRWERQDFESGGLRLDSANVAGRDLNLVEAKSRPGDHANYVLSRETGV